MLNKRVFIFPLLLIIVAALLLFLNFNNQKEVADDKEREIEEPLILPNNDLSIEAIVEAELSAQEEAGSINQEGFLEDIDPVDPIEVVPELEVELIIEEDEEINDTSQSIKKQMIVVEKED